MVTQDSGVFHAVADPTRRAILDRLRDGGQAVNEIAGRFDVSRPAISKHLRVLHAGATGHRSPRRPQPHLPAQPRTAARTGSLARTLPALLGAEPAQPEETRGIQRERTQAMTKWKCAGSAIVAEIEIAAPPETVFDALTTPARTRRLVGRGRHVPHPRLEDRSASRRRVELPGHRSHRRPS